MTISLDKAQSHDEHAEFGLERVLATFAPVPTLLGTMPMPEAPYDGRKFKDEHLAVTELRVWYASSEVDRKAGKAARSYPSRQW